MLQLETIQERRLRMMRAHVTRDAARMRARYWADKVVEAGAPERVDPLDHEPAKVVESGAPDCAKPLERFRLCTMNVESVSTKE